MADIPIVSVRLQARDPDLKHFEMFLYVRVLMGESTSTVLDRVCKRNPWSKLDLLDHVISEPGVISISLWLIYIRSRNCKMAAIIALVGNLLDVMESESEDGELDKEMMLLVMLPAVNYQH